MTQGATLEAALPANVEAEKVLLGAVLLDNAAWDSIATLGMDDWSLDSHKRIRQSMKRLRQTDPPSAIDIVTLANDLGARSEVEAIGGVAYLAGLTEGLPRRPAIDDYIQILRQKGALRRLMSLCSVALQDASAQGDSPLEIAGRLMAGIEEIAEPREITNRAPIKNFIVDAMANLNREYNERIAPCIPSGIAWFDARTGGGYRHGKISLVCARPNVGKTPWGIQGAVANARAGRKVVIFSLEMEREELMRNLIPYVTELPNVVVTRPWMQTPEQNRQVNLSAETLIDWNISIYDGDMDIDQICWTIDRETRRGEEVLFVLDHFGLIAGGNKDTRTRYNEHSARLRRKMKGKSAALVALCQLRKVNREYADKPPVPDDIKESGNMYEDAYACVILHRAFDKDDAKMSRDVHINLAKLRGGGSIGSTTGHFNTRVLCFEADADLDNHDADYFFA